MIEIYLLCQTHAYLDRATLSSDKDFYGFQSCQNEGRVASGFAIEIFVMYFAINQDALQSMGYDPITWNILNQHGRYSLDIFFSFHIFIQILKSTIFFRKIFLIDSFLYN